MSQFTGEIPSKRKKLNCKNNTKHVWSDSKLENKTVLAQFKA